MGRSEACKAVAEVELWADKLEETGHYFHTLTERALDLYAKPMPDEHRDRLSRAIYRIQRMAKAIN